MEDFEKLQNIGAREISKKTHIALNKIQHILDRNYKELRDGATTHGLLQIIERECHVNLKEWEEEYREFWRNYDGSDDDVGPMVNFKVTHEIVTQNDSQKGVILGALLVVLLGVGFFAFMNFYGNSTASDSIKKTEAQSVEHKFGSQKDSIEEDNITSILEATNSLDASASSPINVLPQDLKETQNVKSENVENLASTIPTNTLNQESLEAVSQEILVSNNSSEVKKTSIVPMRNIWVGIVYLDSKKRTSFLTESAFEIDLTRPQTVVTGHGMLEIDSNGEKSASNSANKMFFIVDKEGNFTQVTQGQYEAETKGLGW